MQYGITKQHQCRGEKEKVKKKKNFTQIIVDQLDDVCRRVVFNTDRQIPWDKCEGSIQNNHFITRSNYKTRWHPLNCFTGTSGANLRHEHAPNFMNLWYIKKYGIKMFEAINNYSRGEATWSRQEYEDLLAFWISHICFTDRTELERDYFRHFKRHDDTELREAYNVYLKSIGERRL